MGMFRSTLSRHAAPNMSIYIAHYVPAAVSLSDLRSRLALLTQPPTLAAARLGSTRLIDNLELS